MHVAGWVYLKLQRHNKERSRQKDKHPGDDLTVYVHTDIFVSDKYAGKVSNNSPVASNAENTAVQCVQE